MSYWDISMAVDMITQVATGAPGYGYEFGQLVTTVQKFRDYFYAVKVTYGIPQSLLTELDGYITLLPEIKFGDVARSKDQNNLVEAIRVISELIPYIAINYFKSAWYTSPLLERYYTSYYTGSWDNFWNGNIYSYFQSNLWRHRTAHPTGYTKAGFEHWFAVNRYFGSVKARIKCRIPTGKTGQNHVGILFLSNGSPKPLSPINQRLCVTDRGDVTIEDQMNIVKLAGVSDYDQNQTLTINATCPYFVVVCHDQWSDQEVHIDMLQVDVTPQ